MNDTRRHLLSAVLLCTMGFALGGCPPANGGGDGITVEPNAGTLQFIAFTDPNRPVVINDGQSHRIRLEQRSARNETISFALRIDPFPRTDLKSNGRKREKASPGLRFPPLKLDDAHVLPASAYRVYQVLPVLVDANRAGFVRHSGLPLTAERLPRALVPLPLDGNGVLSLASIRNVAQSPPLLWVDVQVPPAIDKGRYHARWELPSGDEKIPSGWLDVVVEIDDFVLPDERHLQMIGRIDWEALRRVYPEAFQTITPELLSRDDTRQAAAIKALDELVMLTQSHRAQLVVPRLQPIVKWPAGQPVQINWEEFDAVVGPWLEAGTFPDLVPFGYWPIPPFDGIELQGRTARMEYWKAAAGHFDEMQWINRGAVELAGPESRRPSPAESMDLSREAAEILDLHPAVRVSLPCEQEQVHLAAVNNPKLIPAAALERVLYAAAGLASASPLRKLPEEAGIRFMRTDLPALIPYVGAGADEREVRLMAWLAFMRKATLVQWGDVLPRGSSASEPAVIDDLVWFYPGAWFGVEGPVPSLHLKWVRRAQQDYEYLYLAAQRDQAPRALVLAALLAKPVEMQPGQEPDPIDALMSSTSNPAAWDEAVRLLARTVMVAQPGQPPSAAAELQLGIDVNTWTETQQKPILLPRALEWSYAKVNQKDVAVLRMGMDIYNAAHQQPEGNKVLWSAAPAAWDVGFNARDIPKLGVYRIERHFLDAQVQLEKLTPAVAHEPFKASFVHGYTGEIHHVQAVAPVSVCERRHGPAPRIDGSLGEWQAEDAIHAGKLIQMLSRPSVQNHEVRRADTPSAVYTTWTPAGLYLGFKVEGLDGHQRNAVVNYVQFDFRRAWGEDLVEILAQPIYADGSSGALVHLGCKPQGSVEVSRRLSPRRRDNPFIAVAGVNILYGATHDQDTWRGEVVVPWEAFDDPANAANRAARPVLLKLNFVHHRGATGESASWAGPIDYGRDDSFMGLLHFRP
jgi:hypothetical protein